jgi:hypothetical protein
MSAEKPIQGDLSPVPGASLVALRQGMRSMGVDSPRVIGFSDPRANSRGLRSFA